ncbi:MAG: hypothetical protein KA275_09580 [Chitinophagaceae bacterium]|nr:hypothetical protein [Chitinophagaceae bacterium]
MKKPLFDDDELFYLNDKGFVVFTAQYLLDRGYCCGNSCLNCPYEYKNVANKSKIPDLIAAQKKRNVDNEK